MDYILIGLCVLLLVIGVINLILLFIQRTEFSRELRENRMESSRSVSETIGNFGNMLNGSQETLQKSISAFVLQSNQQMEAIRSTVQVRLSAMQEENTHQLEKMRETVDEKLQKTLEERISKSFQLVNDRLEQVYTGLGEMKTLAAGVGDLKKVLSGVKTRGILGEIQLGAILEQLLSTEQYETNVVTKKGSKHFVEYAIRLPGDGDGRVYLPIDAKFPSDAYTQLMDAYESGDTDAIHVAGLALEQRIKRFAKDIQEKYLDPPHTTDFGIMFLPVEGLYAEVVRRGLIETLQREYHINIAGPTTMAAILNSLQMGFRTLAIQKRSSEVWDVLGAVKTEFDKFGVVITQAQQRLEQAHSELDKLVGVRTRQIQRKLTSVTQMPEAQAVLLLDTEEDE